MRANRLVVLVLITLFFVVTFVAVMSGKTSHASPIKGADAGAASISIDNAVTFISKSAFALPPEAVEWIISARGYDGPTGVRERADGHR
jgi:hypothetical protein